MSVRGAPGTRNGNTSAFAVFDVVCEVRVVVMVTMRVSYVTAGFRLVKRTERDCVVVARTTPSLPTQSELGVNVVNERNAAREAPND